MLIDQITKRLLLKAGEAFFIALSPCGCQHEQNALPQIVSRNDIAVYNGRNAMAGNLRLCRYSGAREQSRAKHKSFKSFGHYGRHKFIQLEFLRLYDFQP